MIGDGICANVRALLAFYIYKLHRNQSVYLFKMHHQDLVQSDITMLQSVHSARQVGEPTDWELGKPKREYDIHMTN